MHCRELKIFSTRTNEFLVLCASFYFFKTHMCGIIYQAMQLGIQFWTVNRQTGRVDHIWDLLVK